MTCIKYILFLLYVINQPWIIYCQDDAYGWVPKSCLLRSGEKGICRSIFHCPSLYFTNSIKSPVYCGYVSNDYIPIVCCPKEESNNLVRRGPNIVKLKPQITPMSGMGFLKIPPMSGMGFPCGTLPRPTSQRSRNWYRLSHRQRRHVVGGKETAVGEYPWMALIGTKSSTNITWQCDGVLIHPEWVLSAVHCFLENTTYVVRLGEHDVSSTSDGASPQDFSVSEIIFHPEFKSDIGYHDLALLKLEKRIPIKSSIMPICLPSKDDINLIGKTVTLAGWGAEEFGGSLSSVLRDAKVTIFDTKVCDKSYKALPDYESIWPQGITDQNIICAGNLNGGIDACQGDSGGPLMLRKGNKCVVIGIIAKGFGCGLEDFPGIYIAVRTYMKWIREIVFKGD